MNKRFKIPSILILLSGLIFWMQSCKPDETDIPIVTPGKQQPTPYVLNLPSGWPAPNIHPQNPLTVEGVQLGRKLFYDPILSGNQTQACAGCHNQEFAFTDDGKKVSIGSEGNPGAKNAMPLFNLNWNTAYFWDGRAKDVEDQTRMPIEDHLEMNLSMDEAVQRLKDHPEYPELFKKAFPQSGITTLNVQYALAQFLRTMVSTGNKFFEYYQENRRNPEKLMTEQQKRGYMAFISEEKGDCFHCHSPVNPLFINLNEREFANNGLDANPEDGLYKTTGNINDKGKFKTPSLLNLEYTAPYMHDGRFATLMEVLDHYDSGFKDSPTLDPVLGAKHMDPNTHQPIPRLSQQDKEDIIEFLKLLSDPAFLDNPEYKKP